ncbi:MAG: hypothetical protein J6F30_14370 [Cellulosilyticum sp.]|nr:hypothetical protein [Cellulosilyticum sp.]
MNTSKNSSTNPLEDSLKATVNNPLEVIEVFSKTYDATTGLIHERLKITNISSDYINNLKLIISDQEHALLEQQVTRERGSLSFEPTTSCLELGNLGPDESAFFEYKYSSKSLPTSFTDCISLTYGDADKASFPEKKIVEFISNSTTK